MIAQAHASSHPTMGWLAEILRFIRSSIARSLKIPRPQWIFWLVALLLFLNPLFLHASDPSPRLILCLGDSITAGLGIDPLRAWPARLQDKGDEVGYSLRVLNRAGRSETITAVLSRLDALLTPPPDVVIIALGREEGGLQTDLETLQRKLGRLLDAIREKSPTTHIVLAGQKLSRKATLSYHTRFAALFAVVAQEHQTALVPDLLENVQGVSRLLQADQLHPTSEGQKQIADNVWKILLPLLSKPKTGAAKPMDEGITQPKTENAPPLVAPTGTVEPSTAP